MKKIVILGAGMVGKAMAIDLCQDFDVTAIDINARSLETLSKQFPIRTIQEDLSNPDKVKIIIADFELVIGAVPGFLGFQTLKAVIEAGKNIVDISFFNEDPFELDELARQHEVIAVVDCGVAPGMSNMILGYHDKQMKIERFECMVGGLPVMRTYPYQYKAPFSPIYVIEEYTRPARLVEKGTIIIRPALSDPELIEFHEIGTLEAFFTDGLRTLLKTMNHIPEMKEKTLRYPGHIELIRILRETGFFRAEPVEINHQKIRPIDLTSKLLFPLWKLNEGEDEFTIMRLIIEGSRNGRPAQYGYSLLDRYDKQTNISSMARTTGYPCTAVARLILDHHFTSIGINPPEYVGANEACFKKVLNDLLNRHIHYQVSESR